MATFVLSTFISSKVICALPALQDVVEIMKESLYDTYMDEHGFVDFGRSSGMSQQKEAKRFLSALNKQSELQQKDCFSISVCCLFSLQW